MLLDLWTQQIVKKGKLTNRLELSLRLVFAFPNAAQKKEVGFATTDEQHHCLIYKYFFWSLSTPGVSTLSVSEGRISYYTIRDNVIVSGYVPFCQINNYLLNIHYNFSLLTKWLRGPLFGDRWSTATRVHSSAKQLNYILQQGVHQNWTFLRKTYRLQPRSNTAVHFQMILNHFLMSFTENIRRNHNCDDQSTEVVTCQPCESLSGLGRKMTSPDEHGYQVDDDVILGGFDKRDAQLDSQVDRLVQGTGDLKRMWRSHNKQKPTDHKWQKNAIKTDMYGAHEILPRL